MITQIEIDGFKTFKDFKVELAPFQVIVGPNGSGKSNLFDALQLVSQLMIPGNDVYKAMQGIRGEAGELFTKYPDGTTSDTIRIAIEMLIDRKAKFLDSSEIDLKFARFRYELEIRGENKKDDLYQQYHDKQQLKMIPATSDNWCTRSNISSKNSVIEQELIFQNIDLPSTLRRKLLDEVKTEMVNYLESGLSVDKFFESILVNFNRMYNFQAICSNIIENEFRLLSFYHFNPEALRKRSSTSAPRHLAPDGSNLPATLARIKAEDPLAFQLISHDITSLVSDVLSIDVEKYDAIGEYGIRVTTSDKRTFTA